MICLVWPVSRSECMNPPLQPVYGMPQGFRLPPAYLELINAGPVDLDPWWLLAERKESLDFWTRTLHEQYPNRPLVPFAKRDDTGDDIAAFDATDTSGNPKVLHIHAFSSPG